MSASALSPPSQKPAARWKLWVDGGGGYLVLEGNRWAVGGAAGASTAEICVQADWPRQAGEIGLVEGDFFWHESGHQQRLLRPGKALPVAGSARMLLEQPSQLSESAVLRLAPPHRFVGHVDGVILFRDTLLIGPAKDAHVRCPHLQEGFVLTRRGNQWLVKPARNGKLIELATGIRTTIDNLAITLEAS